MVKRQTIGKIQIVFGILLIISFIFVYFTLPGFVGKRISEIQSSITDNKIELASLSGNLNLDIGYTNFLFSLIGFEIIGFILAIILILQGLANLSEEKK